MALPKGTRYFAIHSIATDSYALMIDDIEYEMAPIFYSGYISKTNTEMSIPKGVYIIRVGNQFSQKVVVD